MSHPTYHARARRAAGAVGTVAILLAGYAVAVVVGTAAASSFTLRVATVHDINSVVGAPTTRMVNKHEAVAVGPSGFPVYTFQGEFVHGATRHLICHKTTSPKTNCWAFWPPVSASSSRHLSVPPALKKLGKLGTFLNHGTRQLTLNGKPLYYFAPDIMSGNKHRALGDLLNTFGSVWHLVLVRLISTGPPTTTTTTTTSTTTTTTTPYPTTTMTTTTATPSPPPMTSPTITTTPPTSCIPQGAGAGDGDSDNQGAPSDGDGCM